MGSNTSKPNPNLSLNANPSHSEKPNASKLTAPELSSLAHWAMYGQPGAPPSRVVLKADWPSAKPFVSPQSASWGVKLRDDDVEKLLLGFRPREMEDKWFIYAEHVEKMSEKEDRWDEKKGGGNRFVVKFFRSWTGFLVAEMEIVVRAGKEGVGMGEKGEKWEGKGKGEARVVGLKWEESKEVVRNQREKDAQETVREVCRWVLDVQLEAEE